MTMILITRDRGIIKIYFLIFFYKLFYFFIDLFFLFFRYTLCEGYWKNICCPPLMPLGTKYFPPDVTGAPINLSSNYPNFTQLLIGLRLSHNFQLVDT